VGCKGRKKQVAYAGNRQRFYFKFLLLYSLIIFLRRIISLENFYSLIKLIQITKFRMLHHVSHDPLWAVGLKNKKRHNSSSYVARLTYFQIASACFQDTRY
jgi:hypothetical protein